MFPVFCLLCFTSDFLFKIIKSKNVLEKRKTKRVISRPFCIIQDRFLGNVCDKARSGKRNIPKRLSPVLYASQETNLLGNYCENTTIWNAYLLSFYRAQHNVLFKIIKRKTSWKSAILWNSSCLVTGQFSENHCDKALPGKANHFGTVIFCSAYITEHSFILNLCETQQFATDISCLSCFTENFNFQNCYELWNFYLPFFVARCK